MACAVFWIFIGARGCSWCEVHWVKFGWRIGKRCGLALWSLSGSFWIWSDHGARGCGRGHNSINGLDGPSFSSDSTATSGLQRRLSRWLRLLLITQNYRPWIGKAFGDDTLVGSGCGRWCQHRKLPTKLVFGQFLSPFFGGFESYQRQGLIWLCSRRQGRSIGGGVLTCGGNDRLDGVWEIGLVLLSHCSSKPLLGDFSNNKGFLSSGYWSGFVLSVEECSLELLVCQTPTWATHTEICKLVVFLHFFASLFQWESSGPFSGDDRLFWQYFFAGFCCRLWGELNRGSFFVIESLG